MNEKEIDSIKVTVNSHIENEIIMDGEGEVSGFIISI